VLGEIFPEDYLIIDDGISRVILCPNCSGKWASGFYNKNPQRLTILPTEILETKPCLLCKKQGIYIKRDTIEEFLCKKHLIKFINRSLCCSHYGILEKKFGESVYY
jgi:hypothetical protein